MSEIGAAMMHEINGPLTALLLYVGDLYRHSDRFTAEDSAGEPLKQVVENALREAERLRLLLQRIGESFEAPLERETAVRLGRDVIRWWSQASRLKNDREHVSAVPELRKPLTPRECEVLCLVIEGCSNKEGGLRMQISPRTFESHRAKIMRKFRAKNTADMIRLSQLIPEYSSSGQTGVESPA